MFLSIACTNQKWFLYGGTNKTNEQKHIWACTQTKSFKIFKTYFENSKDLVIDFSNIKQSFEKVEKLGLLGDLKALKDKWIEDMIAKELDTFIASPTKETMSKTVFLRHAQYFLNQCPLFKPKLQKKKTKNPDPPIGDAFFVLAPILKKIDSSFRTNLSKEVLNLLQGLYLFVIKQTGDKNLSEMINDQLSGDVKPEENFGLTKEDINIASAILNLDEPLVGYKRMKETKSFNDLPQRYKFVLSALRMKLAEFLKLEKYGPEHTRKMKWLNRALYLTRPFLATFNPIKIIDGILSVLVFSKAGRKGMRLILEISKTEKSLKAVKKEIDSKVAANIEGYLNNMAMHDIHELISNDGISIPSPESLKPITKDSKKESTKPLFDDKMIAWFKNLLFDTINKKSEEINSKIQDSQLELYMQFFWLNVRYKEKKDFLDLIEEPEVEKMVKTVMRATMPALIQFYDIADVSKTMKSFSKYIEAFIKNLDEDLKLRKKEEALLKSVPTNKSKMSEEEKQKAIQQNQEKVKQLAQAREHQFVSKLEQLFKQLDEDIFVFLHDLVVNDSNNEKMIEKVIAWLAGLFEVMKDRYVDMEEICLSHKDEKQRREAFAKSVEWVLLIN